MEIEKDLLCSFYKEMYDELGEKVMFDFYKYYGGLTLNVPKRIYDSKKVKEFICKNYLGKKMTKEDVKNLVSKYGYSEGYIRKIVSNK